MPYGAKQISSTRGATEHIPPVAWEKTLFTDFTIVISGITELG